MKVGCGPHLPGVATSSLPASKTACSGIQDNCRRGQEIPTEACAAICADSLRHTFLTRLAESGCDVWTLARIAGHSSIAMSARYVHPSDYVVLNAIAHMHPQAEVKSQGTRPALPA